MGISLMCLILHLTHGMDGQNDAASSEDGNDGAETINNLTTGTGSLQSINCNNYEQQNPTASVRTEFHRRLKETESQKELVSEDSEQATADDNGQTIPANEADTTEPESPQLSVIASHIFVLEILYLSSIFYNLFAVAGEFTFYAFAVDFSVSMDVLSLTEAALGIKWTGCF